MAYYFLYSINSILAYKINEVYYKGTHYVWCAPRFDCTDNPPSSNPKMIIQNWIKDVQLDDHHSSKIQQNRLGLLHGIEMRYSQGIIDKIQRDDLISIANNANISYFRPLIYVIPYQRVKKKILHVSYRDKASPFSTEYKIENLLSNEFDIIDII